MESPPHTCRILGRFAASFFIPLLLGCATPVAPAPFEPGKQRSSLEYDMSFRDSTSDLFVDTEEDSVRLSITHGYFVTANVEVGGELGFLEEEFTDDAGTVISRDAFAIGAYGRYYFITDASTRPYAELGLGVGTGEVTVSGSSQDSDLTVFSLGFGLLQSLSEFTALDAGLRFQSVDEDVDTSFGSGEVDTDVVALSVGYTIFW